MFNPNKYIYYYYLLSTSVVTLTPKLDLVTASTSRTLTTITISSESKVIGASSTNSIDYFTQIVSDNVELLSFTVSSTRNSETVENSTNRPVQVEVIFVLDYFQILKVVINACALWYILIIPPFKRELKTKFRKTPRSIHELI